MSTKFQETVVFKETSDDWCPSYSLGHGVFAVKVRIHKAFVNNAWVVSVWGSDDTGMEKVFVTEEEARSCFMVVLYSKDVTMAFLKTLGFVYI